MRTAASTSTSSGAQVGRAAHLRTAARGDAGLSDLTGRRDAMLLYQHRKGANARRAIVYLSETVADSLPRLEALDE